MAGELYEKYDSAAFGTITESIVHSKTNPMIASKFAGELVITLGVDYFRIREPSSPLRDLFTLLEGEFVDTFIPNYEFYKPEHTSKRLYNTHELWNLILVINGMPNNLEYTQNNIKTLPVDKLYLIQRFLEMSKEPAPRVFTQENTYLHTI